MPINTGPYGMRGRRTRGGRRGNRFSNPSPSSAPVAPNQFHRDDSVPAGSVPPTTATTPPAGTTPINVSMPSNATPAGTVNTNPSGVSMPGTMMNAGIPPASTPAAGIQGQTGLDRPLASQQPPNQQMGPNNPMGAELPAAGAGVNTNPTNPDGTTKWTYDKTSTPGKTAWAAGMNWAAQRGKPTTQKFGTYTSHYNPSADMENDAYWEALKKDLGADNPYAQKPKNIYQMYGQQAGYTLGGKTWK